MERINAELEVLDKEIEARNDEPRPPRRRKRNKPAGQNKEKQNQASVWVSENQDATAEDLFKMLIKKVNGRINAIKFEKKDYQTLSKVQSQLDLLLFDLSTEIEKIKTSAQIQFEKVQKLPAARENNKQGAERLRNRNGERSGFARDRR